jgi:NDP-sugar pyrophosphorylase family protein
MKAMILAAGLGTRLRPLTDTCPKALVEIAGRTLLEITLTRLRAFGIREVIINVHHFADRVIDYLKSNKNFGMRLEISREEVLLDTGGGLKKAAWFFLENSASASSSRPRSTQMDEPFLLHNVDVLSTIDFARMLQFHKERRALATLAVQARETSRPLLFDNNLQLRGRRTSSTPVPRGSEEGTTPAGPEPAERGSAPQTTATHNPRGTTSALPNSIGSPRSQESTASVVPKNEKNSRASAPEVPLQSLAFSGIHIISPRLLSLLTEEGIFSIIPAYLRLAAQGQPILAFRADTYYWRDLGRPTDLAQATLDLEQKTPGGSERNLS